MNYQSLLHAAETLRLDLDQAYPDRAEYDLPSTVIDRLDRLLAAHRAGPDPQPIRSAASVGYNIVNQLADLWEVPVDVRQATNDRCWTFVEQLVAAAVPHPTREQVARVMHEQRMGHSFQGSGCNQICSARYFGYADAVLALLNGSAT